MLDPKRSITPLLIKQVMHLLDWNKILHTLLKLVSNYTWICVALNGISLLCENDQFLKDKQEKMLQKLRL